MQLKPQPKQEKFLKSTADIVIYGGSAGGGKTYALLMEPLYHINNDCFRAVIFRQSLRQVLNAGGLWDTAMEIYPLLGGEGKVGNLEFTFKNNSKIKFDYLQLDKDVYKWQGSQIPLIMFDELTHFTKKQFFYMLSRNRSVCGGIKPYIRATTNPDSESWVRELIDWWIDKETGLPIPERDGKIRYFVNYQDMLHFADTREELQERFKHSIPKSITFISATIQDNQELLKNNPDYISNLMALPKVERERLLGGNWNIKNSAGNYFKRSYFEVIEKDEVSQYQVKKECRAWDFAFTKPSETNPDPDYLVGLKGYITPQNEIIVTDMFRDRLSPEQVEKSFKNITKQDGKSVIQRIPIDPAGGKLIADRFVRMVRGYPVKAIKVIKDKETRALPASAMSERGEIKIVRADWNADFLSELEMFPDGKHDDIVDTLSDLVDMLLQLTKTTKTRTTSRTRTSAVKGF